MTEAIVLNAYTAQALGGNGEFSTIPGVEAGGDRGLVAEGFSLPFWLKLLRVGRSLRPLRLLDRFAATRRLVQAIASGGAQILDAALLNTLTLFAFATAARDLFALRMGQCTDESVSLRELCRGTFLQDDGTVALRTWLTPTANFDSLLSALGTLSRMIMLEVWSPIMFRAMDIAGPNKGPEQDKSYFFAFFFIIFIFVVSFILLQLVLGIVLEHLARVSGSADMTSKQRRWLNLQRFVLHFSPAPQRALLRMDFDSPVADSATAAALLSQVDGAGAGTGAKTAQQNTDTTTSAGGGSDATQSSDAPQPRRRVQRAVGGAAAATDDTARRHTSLAKQLLSAMGGTSHSDHMREQASKPAVQSSDALSRLYPGIQYFLAEGHRRVVAALAGVAMATAADGTFVAATPGAGDTGRSFSPEMEQGTQGGVETTGGAAYNGLESPNRQLLRRVQRKVAVVQALAAGQRSPGSIQAGTLVGSTAQGVFSFDPALLSSAVLVPTSDGGDAQTLPLGPAHTSVRDAILMDATVGTDTMGTDALLSPDIQRRKKARRGRGATSTSARSPMVAGGTDSARGADASSSSSSDEGGDGGGDGEDAAFGAAVLAAPHLEGGTTDSPMGAARDSSLPEGRPLAHASMSSAASGMASAFPAEGGDAKAGPSLYIDPSSVAAGTGGPALRKSATVTRTPKHMTPHSKQRFRAERAQAQKRLMLKQGPAVAPPCFQRSCRAIAQDRLPYSVFRRGDQAVVACSEGGAAMHCACCDSRCCVGCQESILLFVFRLRDAAFRFISRRAFNAFITVCILLNVVALMTTHYPMDESFRSGIHLANRVFLGVFAFEVLLKWLGLGLETYFRDTWDVFDFVLVAGSIVFEVLPDTFPFGVEAGRVFRVARLARIFRKIPSLRILFDTAVVSLGSLVNITLVLLLWLFVFAVLGMTLFSDLGASRAAIHQWPLPQPNAALAFNLLPSVLNNSACFASGPGFVLGLLPPTESGNQNTLLGSKLGAFPEQDDDSGNTFSSELTLQQVYAATLAQAERDLVQVFGFSEVAAAAQMSLTNWTWAGLVEDVQTTYTANGSVVAPGTTVPGQAAPAPAAVQGVQQLSVCEAAPAAYILAVEFAEKVLPLQAVNRHNHFRTFGSSLLILLRMATGKYGETHQHKCSSVVLFTLRVCLAFSFARTRCIFCFAGGDWPLIYSDTVSFTQATNLYFFSFTLIITLVVLAFYLGSVLENFQQSVSVPLACSAQ